MGFGRTYYHRFKGVGFPMKSARGGRFSRFRVLLHEICTRWYRTTKAPVAGEAGVLQLLTDLEVWRAALFMPTNIFFLVINPLAEEFFWRIFLHRELGER